MGSNVSLSARTRDAIEEIWMDSEPNLEGIFSEHFVETVLSDESFQSLSSTENGLSFRDINEIVKTVRLKGASLDVGVPPGEISSAVEQLLLELSVACSRHTPQARKFERRKQVLQGLHEFMSRSVPKSKSTDTLESQQTEDDGSANQWPSEYIATQQVGLSLLCSFLEAIPTNAVPTKPLSDLVKTLEALGPLRLFEDWSGPQRSYAERELDVLSMEPPPEPYCSTCGSQEHSGPKRPLQPGSLYWCSKAKREHSEWGVRFASTITVSSIVLNWHKASLPERVTVKVSNDRGVTYTKVATSMVPSRDSAEMLIALPVPHDVTDLQLVFTKFAKCNIEGSGRCHKLERIKIMEPLLDLPNVPTRQVVTKLTSWLLEVAQKSNIAGSNENISGVDDSNDLSLSALQLLALASGSLEALLALVQLIISQNAPILKSSPANELVSYRCAKLLTNELEERCNQEVGKNKLKTFVCTKKSRLHSIRSLFRVAATNSEEAATLNENKGMCISKSGRCLEWPTMTSIGAACLLIKLDEGCCSWEFKLGGEATDGIWFGVGRLSHVEDAFELAANKQKTLILKEKWLVEAKTGRQRNAQGECGAALSAVDRVHCDDIVRFSLDLDHGTLEMFINNVSQGILFRDVGGRVVPIIECHVVTARSSSLNAAANNGGSLLRKIELIHGRVNVETPAETPVGATDGANEYIMNKATHLLCGMPELEAWPSSEMIGRHGVLPKVTGSVEVGGVFQPHSISMLNEGDIYNKEGVFMTFPLAPPVGCRPFTVFHSMVGIGCNSHSNLDKDIAVNMEFDVLLDGVQVWKSPKFTDTKDSFPLKVDVTGASELQLRVKWLEGSVGSPAFTGVWMRPVLDTMDEKSEASVESEVKSEVPLEENSLLDMGIRIMVSLGQLSLKHTCKDTVSCSASLSQARQPFCVEATAETMTRIGGLLDSLVRWDPNEKKEGGFLGTESQRDKLLLATLRLGRANIANMSKSISQSPPDDQSDIVKLVTPLRITMEDLMSADHGITSSDVQQELSLLIEDGVDLLYPSESDVADLMGRLLDQVLERRVLGGVQVLLLEQLMKKWSSPGNEQRFRRVLHHRASSSSDSSKSCILLPRILNALGKWNEQLAELTCGSSLISGEYDSLQRLADAATSLLQRNQYLLLTQPESKKDSSSPKISSEFKPPSGMSRVVSESAILPPPSPLSNESAANSTTGLDMGVESTGLNNTNRVEESKNGDVDMEVVSIDDMDSDDDDEKESENQMSSAGESKEEGILNEEKSNEVTPIKVKKRRIVTSKVSSNGSLDDVPQYAKLLFSHCNDIADKVQQMCNDKQYKEARIYSKRSAIYSLLTPFVAFIHATSPSNDLAKSILPQITSFLEKADKLNSELNSHHHIEECIKASQVEVKEVLALCENKSKHNSMNGNSNMNTDSNDGTKFNFSATLHGPHALLEQGRRVVVNLNSNQFTNAVCDLPGQEGHRNPHGVKSGRHVFSWRVLRSTPYFTEEHNCGMGVGCVSVNTTASSQTRRLSANSLAFTSDSYLPRQHAAWFFECSGTRFHDPDIDSDAYGRPFDTDDVVSLVMDYDELAHTSTGIKKGTIRFQVNGIDLGIAFSGIDGYELLPAVWLYGPQDTLEALSYEGTLCSDSLETSSSSLLPEGILLRGFTDQSLMDPNENISFRDEVKAIGSSLLNEKISHSSFRNCQLLVTSSKLLGSKLKQIGADNWKRVMMSLGSDEGWNTALASPAIDSLEGGLHAWEVVVSEVGSKHHHLCIGMISLSKVCCGLKRSDNATFSQNLSQVLDSGIGDYGWGMLGDGSLWYKDEKGLSTYFSNYGDTLCDADVVGVSFDMDGSFVIRFSVNGRDLGPAFGPIGSGAKITIPVSSWLNSDMIYRLFPAISIYSPGPRLGFKSYGLLKGTLQLPWLHELLTSLSHLGGFLSHNLILGEGPDMNEVELSPWLDAPCMLGGIPEKLSLKLKLKKASGNNTEKELLQNKLDVNSRQENIINKFLEFGEQDDVGSGASTCCYLDCVAPDRWRRVKIMKAKMPGNHKWTPEKEYEESKTVQSKLERKLFVCMVKHAGMLDELDELMNKLKNKINIENDSIKELVELWSAVQEFRVWVYDRKQAFLTIEADSDERAAAKREEVSSKPPVTDTSTSNTSGGGTSSLSAANPPSTPVTPAVIDSLATPAQPSQTGEASPQAVTPQAVTPQAVTPQAVTPPQAASPSQLSALAHPFTPGSQTSAISSESVPKEVNVKIEGYLVEIPSTFVDLERHLDDRISFMLSLEPAVPPKSLSANGDESPNDEVPPPPGMMRTLSSNGDDFEDRLEDEKFGNVLGVLRSQLKWRQQNRLAGMVYKDDLKPGSKEDDDVAVEWKAKARVLSRSVRGVAWSVKLYVTDGTCAPPKLMRKACRRRRNRAKNRAFGLEKMEELVNSLSSRSALMDVLVHLRPALAGLGPVQSTPITVRESGSSAVAGESLPGGGSAGAANERGSESDTVRGQRDTHWTPPSGITRVNPNSSTQPNNGGASGADGDSSEVQEVVKSEAQRRVNVRNHPLRGLDGGGSVSICEVRSKFNQLYQSLAGLLKHSVNDSNGFDSGVACLVIWCFGLDFMGPNDHNLLLNSSLLETLLCGTIQNRLKNCDQLISKHKFRSSIQFGIEEQNEEEEEEKDGPGISISSLESTDAVTTTVTSPASTSSWTPWSQALIKRGLADGFVTKVEVLDHMWQIPRKISPPASWWKTHALLPDGNINSVIETCNKISEDSLLKSHRELTDHLICIASGGEVGVNTNMQMIELEEKDDTKCEHVHLSGFDSLIELGYKTTSVPMSEGAEVAASPCTMDMWLRPMELHGTRALLCGSDFPITLNLEGSRCRISVGEENSFLFPKRLTPMKWTHLCIVIEHTTKEYTAESLAVESAEKEAAKVKKELKSASASTSDRPERTSSLFSRSDSRSDRRANRRDSLRDRVESQRMRLQTSTTRLMNTLNDPRSESMEGRERGVLESQISSLTGILESISNIGANIETRLGRGGQPITSSEGGAEGGGEDGDDGSDVPSNLPGSHDANPEVQQLLSSLQRRRNGDGGGSADGARLQEGWHNEAESPLLTRQTSGDRLVIPPSSSASATDSADDVQPASPVQPTSPDQEALSEGIGKEEKEDKEEVKQKSIIKDITNIHLIINGENTGNVLSVPGRVGLKPNGKLELGKLNGDCLSGRICHVHLWDHALKTELIEKLPTFEINDILKDFEPEVIVPVSVPDPSPADASGGGAVAESSPSATSDGVRMSYTPEELEAMTEEEQEMAAMAMAMVSSHQREIAELENAIDICQLAAASIKREEEEEAAKAEELTSEESPPEEVEKPPLSLEEEIIHGVVGAWTLSNNLNAVVGSTAKLLNCDWVQSTAPVVSPVKETRRLSLTQSDSIEKEDQSNISKDENNDKSMSNEKKEKSTVYTKSQQSLALSLLVQGNVCVHRGWSFYAEALEKERLSLASWSLFRLISVLSVGGASSRRLIEEEASVPAYVHAMKKCVERWNKSIQSKTNSDKESTSQLRLGVLPQSAVQVSEGEPLNISEAALGTSRILRSYGRGLDLLDSDNKITNSLHKVILNSLAENAHLVTSIFAELQKSTDVKSPSSKSQEDEVPPPIKLQRAATAPTGQSPTHAPTQEVLSPTSSSVGVLSNRLSKAVLLIQMDEAEKAVYTHLRFLVSIASTTLGFRHLATKHVLGSIVPLIETGSPRIQRLVLALLSDVASLLAPATLAHALPSYCSSGLTPWLLGIVGKVLNIDAHQFDPHSSEQPESTLSWQARGLGCGALMLAHAHDIVDLIVMLLRTPAYESQIIPFIRNIFALTTRQLHADEMLSVEMCESLSATLAVLGGLYPMLRVGGVVALDANQAGLSRAATEANALSYKGESNKGQVLATIVSYNSSNETQIAFNGYASCSVKTDLLTPVSFHGDEALPKCIVKDDDLCSLFMRLFQLLKKKMDSVTAETDVCLPLDISASSSNSLSASGASVSTNNSLFGHDKAHSDNGSSNASRLSALWVLALRCFPKVLVGRGPSVSSSTELIDLLYDASLRTVPARGFLTVRALEYRSRVISERMIAAASVRSNDLLFTSDSSDDFSSAREAEAKLKAEAVKEMRYQTALALTEFGGQDINLCIKALELNDDNMERSANWLFSEEAFGFMDGGLGGGDTGGGGGGGANSDGSNGFVGIVDIPTAERWTKAETLVGFYQQPPKLCFHALEMCNDDMQAAADWLGQENGGKTYYRLMMSEEKAEIVIEKPNYGMNGEAIGCQDGFITDSMMSASSVLSQVMTNDVPTAVDPEHSKFAPHFGRLNSCEGGGGWSPSTNEAGQYLQVDLGGVRVLHGVAVQGKSNDQTIDTNSPLNQYVTSYTIETSQDGITFTKQETNNPLPPTPLTEEEITSGVPLRYVDKYVYKGSSDCDNVVASSFVNVVKARYVRFKVLTWHGAICLRVEVYGEGFGLGVMSATRLNKSDSLSNIQGSYGLLKLASASTESTVRLLKDNVSWSSLNNKVSENWFHHGESWCCDIESTEKHWLEVDFGSILNVKAIALMGNVKEGIEEDETFENSWVTSFSIEFMNDEEKWVAFGDGHVFEGNLNRSSLVTHELIIKTSKVRFLPLTWNHLPFMRPEIYVSSKQENQDGTLRMQHALTTLLDESVFTCSSHEPSFPPQSCKLLQNNGSSTSSSVLSVGWCPDCSSLDDDSIQDYLEIDLTTVCDIQGVATAGGGIQALANKDDIFFVTKFAMSVSSDRISWSKEIELEGNDSSNWNKLIIRSLPEHLGENKWYGRFIRVRPITWIGKPVLRLEFYGLSIGPPLGLQNESISNDQLSASSFTNAGPPKFARLGCAGSWRPEKSASRPYLTVKLKGKCLLSGIATSGGCADGELPGGFAANYRLEVALESGSSSGGDWRSIGSFEGNYDETSVRYHAICDDEGNPIKAKFVRLIVTKWGYNASDVEEPALRLELFGIGVEEPCGLGSGSLADTQIKASSQNLIGGSAMLGRLNGRGSWHAASQNRHQWLRVDLKQRRTIVAVATQGRGHLPDQQVQQVELNRQPMHVSSYFVEYSNDGDIWKAVSSNRVVGSDSSGINIFNGNIDNHTVVTHHLLKPIYARFIRFRPLTWYNGIALRAEVYVSSLNTGAAMEDDAAAFEDAANETRPIMLESSNEVTNVDASISNQTLTLQQQQRMDELNGDIEATLVRVSVTSDESDLRNINPDTVSVAPRPGMLIIITDDVGKVNRIKSRMGLLQSISDNGQKCSVAMALDSTMDHKLSNTENNDNVEVFSLSSVRTIARFFTEKLKSVEDIRKLKLTTNLALGTHYARAALLALLSQWRDDAASTILETKVKSKEKNTLLKTPSSLSVENEEKGLDLISLRRIYSSGSGNNEDGIVGDCARLVDLVKLIAANEGALRMNSGHDQSADTESDYSSQVGGNIALIRNIFQVLLEVEAKENAPSPREVMSKSSLKKLSQLLVDECCWHFTESTKPTDARQVLMRESLHPYYPKCDYQGEVKVEGATAIRVHFDNKCSIAEGGVLLLAVDRDFTNIIARFTGGPSKFKALLIHSDRFYFRFESRIRGDNIRDGDRRWGYRFFAMPLLGLQWLKEEQVLCDSSLEWACWLLDLLLSHAQKGLLPQGAVHNSKVFSALVRYLRSGGVPYKHRVIALLTRLLQSPQLFTSRDPPSLGLLGGIASLVRDQCDLYAQIAPTLDSLLLQNRLGRQAQAAAAAVALSRGMLTGSGGSGGELLSLRLQALVELVVATQMAERSSLRSTDHHKKEVYSIEKSSKVSSDLKSDEKAIVASVVDMIVETSLSSVTPLSSPKPLVGGPMILKEDIPLAPPIDQLPVLDVVMDTLDCASALLDQKSIPEQFLTEAFLRSTGTQIVVDGEFLLENDMIQDGQIVFKGAKELHIQLLCDSDDEVENEEEALSTAPSVPAVPAPSGGIRGMFGMGGAQRVGGMSWGEDDDFDSDEEEEDEDGRDASVDEREDFDRFVRRMMNRDRRTSNTDNRESTATVTKSGSVIQPQVEADAILELDATMNDYPQHEWVLEGDMEEDIDDDDVEECKEENGAAEEKEDGDSITPVVASGGEGGGRPRSYRGLMGVSRGRWEPRISGVTASRLSSRPHFEIPSPPSEVEAMVRASIRDQMEEQMEEQLHDESTRQELHEQEQAPRSQLEAMSGMVGISDDGLHELHSDMYMAPSAESVMSGGADDNEDTLEEDMQRLELFEQEEQEEEEEDEEGGEEEEDEDEEDEEEEEEEEEEEFDENDLYENAGEMVTEEEEAFASANEDNLMMMMSMGLERSWCLVALRRVQLDVESAVAFCFEHDDSMPRIVSTDFDDRRDRLIRDFENDNLSPAVRRRLTTLPYGSHISPSQAEEVELGAPSPIGIDESRMNTAPIDFSASASISPIAHDVPASFESVQSEEIDSQPITTSDELMNAHESVALEPSVVISTEDAAQDTASGEVTSGLVEEVDGSDSESSSGDIEAALALSLQHSEHDDQGSGTMDGESENVADSTSHSNDHPVGAEALEELIRIEEVPSVEQVNVTGASPDTDSPHTSPALELPIPPQPFDQSEAPLLGLRNIISELSTSLTTETVSTRTVSQTTSLQTVTSPASAQAESSTPRRPLAPPITPKRKVSNKVARLEAEYKGVDAMVMINVGLHFSLLPAQCAKEGNNNQVVVLGGNGTICLSTNTSSNLDKTSLFKLRRHPATDRLANKELDTKKLKGKMNNDNVPLFLIENGEGDGIYLYAAPDGSLQLTRDSTDEGSIFIVDLYNSGKCVALRTLDGRVIMMDSKTQILKADIVGDDYLNEYVDLLRGKRDTPSEVDESDGMIEKGPWYNCMFNMMCRTLSETWDPSHRFTTSPPGRPLGLSLKTCSNFELTCSSSLNTNNNRQQIQGSWSAAAGRVRFPIPRREGQTGDALVDRTPGAWVAGSNDNKQFLSIDLLSVQDLTGFAIQAPYGENMRVRQFNVEFSYDGKTWAPLRSPTDNKITLPGNGDNSSVLIFKLSKPIRARYVKFLPTKWSHAIALRVELFAPHRYRFCSKENKSVESSLIVIPGDKVRFSFSKLLSQTNETADTKVTGINVGEIKDEGAAAAEVTSSEEVAHIAPLFGDGASVEGTVTEETEESKAPSKIKRKQYRFSITAVGLPLAEKIRWLQGYHKHISKVNVLMDKWTSDMDLDLVNWLHSKVDSSSGVKCDSISPSELKMANRDKMQLQRLNAEDVPCWAAFPMAMIQKESVLTDKDETNKDLDVAKIASQKFVEMDAVSMTPLGAIHINMLHIRISLLQCLNNRLRRILPFIDMGAGVDYFSGYKLRKLGYLIFYDLKMELLETSLRSSSGNSHHGVQLNLCHAKKTLGEDCGNVDPATSQCLFAQAFHQSLRASAAQFRGNEGGRAFSVNFTGEAGIDAGGVSRDALTEMVGELHSPEHLNLFALCPNGVHKINSNMDKYIPNPACNSPLAIQMFEFVGKLMGVSLRTKATLPFNFPSLVWKGCVGGTIEVSDIEVIDQVLTQTLRVLVDPQLSETDFEQALPEDVCFTTTTGDGAQEVELVPGGATKPVTYHNRSEYASLVIQHRIHEFDTQLAAIRRGLATVVPLHTLQLFTWQQIEELIAGKPEIDLEYLKAHTEYRGYSSTSPVIGYFWKTMEMLNHVERSMFIRFVWGRSRLPLKGRPWPQTFKIQRCSGGDDMLPQTHTCFFSIELPEYSSETMCHKRLLTAINYGVAGILNS